MANNNGPQMVNGKMISPVEIQKLENSGGKPLPQMVKIQMEAKFNTDLSDVRVHYGPNAARMTSMTGAKAFAVGNRIVISPNTFHTPEGQRLLTHEVTHVIQQKAGKLKR